MLRKLGHHFISSSIKTNYVSSSSQFANFARTNDSGYTSTRHNSTSTQAKQMNGEEVHIPVPWGHLSGKWWGPKNKRPILSFHGWQDNCGTFDTLIPILPSHLSFLTLDFPGHGYSSRIPVGQFYHNMNGVILIRRLQNYFKWEKIALMGHSLGAITSYTFGGLFPTSIEFCICIDGLSPILNAKKLDRVIETVDNFLKYDSHVASTKEPPSYTMDNMIELFCKATKNSVDKDKCIFILERNIKESKLHPGKFYFDRDPRLKSGPLLNWPMDELLEHSSRIDFPLFASRAKKTIMRSYDNVYIPVRKILDTKKDIEFHEVEGTHHGHLNNPEVFAEILPKFIEKYSILNRDIDESVFESIKFKE